MTPAARIQAVIDLVAEIEAAIDRHGPPADRITRVFFQARRYAGSGDRRAISGLVYEVLRHRGRLLWWNELAGGARPPEARSLVLAAVIGIEGRTGADLDAVFSGLGHGPAALEAGERDYCAKLVSAVRAPDMPDWARLDYPAWLDGPLRGRFGDGLDAEITALNARADIDIRVNTSRVSRDQAAREITARGFEVAPCRWSPMGLRLEPPARLDGLDVQRRGVIEVQDEGAQIAALLVEARPRMQVVDLCAGGGGKSLALAALMSGKGQIHAFDRDKRRLARLERRLPRARVRNIQICGRPEGARLAALIARADRVLVDAPCAGSGTWRRNPDLKWRYDGDEIADFAARQGALLDSAAELVAPEGRLVYVTCSLLEAENEEVVRGFLARRPDFTVLPYGDIWRRIAEGAPPASASTLPGCLQLTPAWHQTDGFFIAILDRRGAGG